MTALSPITAAVATLWAKSPKQNADKSQGAWLPVLNHLLDVAACAAEILALEPPQMTAQMAADLGLPPEEGLAWALALIALHDLGKGSPAFQVLWEEGRKQVSPKLPFDPDLREPFTPHGVMTQAVLPEFLKELGWAEQLAKGVADAVGCHHGFRETDQGKLDPATSQRGVKSWDIVRAELCYLVMEAVGAPNQAVPTASKLSAAGFMRLAGLTSFADWLGSSFALPTHTELSGHADPQAYFAAARGRAREVLARIGWPAFAPLRPALPGVAEAFGYVVPDGGFRPRPLQTALAQALADVKEPALVLVEAPMGEGKTEAALYSFLQLQNANTHRGLYVALPTQATGNAMLERLVEFLQAQGSERPVSVQLAHGGTLLNAQFQELVERTRNAPNDPAEGSSASVRAEEWFTSRKRALLDEYGVGTVDQALLGVLGVAHQFVRLWGLGNRVIVLDEVHAYDTYTSELIAALVAWLRALGSSVVVMSATLPRQSRRNLLAAWGVPDVPEQDYPRWTVAQAGGQMSSGTIPSLDEAGNESRPESRVQLRALPGAAGAVAQQAVQEVAGGGCVAVIVNTVQRAQQIQQEILVLLRQRSLAARTCTGATAKGKAAVGVLLYHARYPADERKYREDAVLRHLGKDAASRPERFILIATQVAEQSLDFDADVMITDLAPVDLVLQRAGRLHRHARPLDTRHGHKQAVLYVSGLDQWPDAMMKAAFWERVYEPALLYRTWRTLSGRAEVRLPKDLDTLVQRVYGPAFSDEDLDEIQAAQVRDAEVRMHGRRENSATKGQYAHIGLPEEFWAVPANNHPQLDPDSDAVNDDPAALSQPGDEERPRTRLTEESVRVVPVEKVAGAWRVCPPPRQMLPDWTPLSPSFGVLPKGDVKTGQRIYTRSLGVSRWEVVQAASTGKLCKNISLGNGDRGWAAHPLLRDVVPLDLTRGSLDLNGTVRVRLDPELGLIYESLR